MPYFLIADFKGGLDVRKSPWTAEAGTLQELVNAHITRGGEIEKRKEFTDSGDLLASTFGLVSGRAAGDGTPRTTMVFGSVAAPSLPAGVTYQRLQHPDGVAAMTEVVCTTLYDGKPYVVANFDDDSQWHFYDGELVDDWGAGIVRASMTTNDLIAEHLKELIDASDDYVATRAGAQITVTGLDGIDYEIETETANVDGGTDDQTLTSTELVEAVVEVPGTGSMAEFRILAGSVNAANYIDLIRVHEGGTPVTILSTNVPYGLTAELTGLAVAAEINAGTGTHGYSAITRYGRVIVSAPADDGASADSRVIEVTAKGNVVLYGGGIAIAGGTASAGVNAVSSIKANGVEIMSGAVDWTTSNSATAAAVAANITAFASSPKYNACSEGENVFISPSLIRSDDATAISLLATSIGDVTFAAGTSPPAAEDPSDYDDPPGTGEDNCPSVNAWVLTDEGPVRAGDIKVGDILVTVDPITLERGTGQVTHSRTAEAICYRLNSKTHIDFDCSGSAPIPVRGGQLVDARFMRNYETVVDGGGGPRWDRVEEVDEIGLGLVQNITCENKCFLAGNRKGRYMLHHNLKFFEP